MIVRGNLSKIVAEGKFEGRRCGREHSVVGIRYQVSFSGVAYAVGEMDGAG